LPPDITGFLLGLFHPKDGAIYPSETLLGFQRTARHHIPRDNILQVVRVIKSGIGLGEILLEFIEKL
jgi:hypothetical protein